MDIMCRTHIMNYLLETECPKRLSKYPLLLEEWKKSIVPCAFLKWGLKQRLSTLTVHYSHITIQFLMFKSHPSPCRVLLSPGDSKCVARIQKQCSKSVALKVCSQTSSITITWELFRTINSPAPLNQKLWGRTQQSVFS